MILPRPREVKPHCVSFRACCHSERSGRQATEWRNRRRPERGAPLPGGWRFLICPLFAGTQLRSLGMTILATPGGRYFRVTTNVPVLTPSNDVTRTRYVPVAGATHSNPANHPL